MSKEDADRALITTEGCVVRSGLKTGRGSPKRGLSFLLYEKHNLVEHAHSSRAPGPFWPNRDAVGTLITTVGCVVRRGRKSGHGSPKATPWGLPEGARRGPLSPKGTLNTTEMWIFGKLKKHTHLQNVHPSRAPGPFCPKRTPTERPSANHVGRLRCSSWP